MPRQEQRKAKRTPTQMQGNGGFSRPGRAAREATKAWIWHLIIVDKLAPDHSRQNRAVSGERKAMSRAPAVMFFFALVVAGPAALANPECNMIQNPQRSVRACTLLIEQNPRHSDAYNSRGNALLALGEIDRAIEDYSKQIAINPRHGYAYNGRGNANLAKGDIDGAIDDYTKQVSINPRHPYAYCARADAYQKIGDLDKAIEDYSKQISTNPRHDYAYNGRANAHLAKGDFERAIDD